MRNIIPMQGRATLNGPVSCGLAWPELVGPQVAWVSRPVQLREGVLWVQVDTPEWAVELETMTPDILTRYRAAGGNLVEEIRWIGLKPRLVS